MSVGRSDARDRAASWRWRVPLREAGRKMQFTDGLHITVVDGNDKVTFFRTVLETGYTLKCHDYWEETTFAQVMTALGVTKTLYVGACRSLQPIS